MCFKKLPTLPALVFHLNNLVLYCGPGSSVGIATD